MAQRFSTAFSPRPDPGDLGSNPMSGFRCMELADMMNYIDCFTSVEPALCPGDKSYLVVVNNFLNVLLDPIG